jgi:hypothetical protein
MPEIDPSTSALLARIERLEAGAPQRVAAAPVPAEAVPAEAAPVEAAPAAAAPVAAAPVAPPPPAPARAVANGGSGAQPARAVEPDPEPSPEPEPAFVPAVAVALSVEDAERLWPAVVDTVRQDNAMLSALLADAHAVAIGERELTLAFPTGAAFLKRKAEADDNRRIATQAWRTISGQDLSLRYELRDIGEHQGGAPAMSGEELVRRFIEEFDAEEIVADDSDAAQPEQEQDA